MKKTKPNNRAAAPAERPTKCPVLPIALRVGELWDAHAGAEEREFGKGASGVSEQIELLRMSVEETASFERARSVGGALFQVALAKEMATHLRECVPSEEITVKEKFDRLIRLLCSAALLLRDECPAQDYRSLKRVIEAYLLMDRPDFNAPFQWREDIPDLAKEYRRSEKASTAAI